MSEQIDDNYEAVDMGSPSQITEGDRLADDFLAKFELENGKLESESILSALGVTNVEEVLSDSDASSQEAQVGGVPPVEAEGKEDSSTKESNSGLERLAAKEKEIRDLISKFEEEKKTLSSRPDPKALAEQLKLYPEKVLASLGLDTEQVMKTLLYNKLDDSNPAKAKLREQLKELETNRKFQELEEKLAAKERAISQQEKYQEILTGAEKYAEEVGKSADKEKAYPTLSKLGKADVKILHGLIMREVETDAIARYARGESGDPISYDEAAKRVESQLAPILKLLAGQANTQGTTQTRPSSSSSNSNIRPPASPITKKELSIEDLEERALQNAVVEFHKHRAKTGGRSGVF